MYGRILPQDTNIEAAVLGAMMLEARCIEAVTDIIQRPEVFYKPEHQSIFSAIYCLYTSGAKVDLLTVTDQMRKDGTLESVGVSGLTELTMSVVSSAHVEDHARLLTEKYMQREMIVAGGNMVNMGYDDTQDVFDALNESQQKLFELTDRVVQSGYVSQATSVMEVMMDMDELRNSGKRFSGVPTPFDDMNAGTGGWQNSHLIVIAARPGVGKTAFGLNCALAAARAGVGVGFFNLEMSHNDLTRRNLANASNVPGGKLNRPWLQTQADIESLAAAAGHLGGLKIYIQDKPGLSINDLRSDARKMVKKNGVGIIFVDYLQLITCDLNRSFVREQEIAKISRELKKLAKDLHIPIIAFSQMSRDVEKRGSNEPRLSDLRESGAIEQDADDIFFIWTPDADTLKKRPEWDGKTLITCKKYRSGDAAQEYVYFFNKQYQRFELPSDGEQVIQTPSQQHATMQAAGKAAAYAKQVSNLQYNTPNDAGTPGDMPF